MGSTLRVFGVSSLALDYPKRLTKCFKALPTFEPAFDSIDKIEELVPVAMADAVSEMIAICMIVSALVLERVQVALGNTGITCMVSSSCREGNSKDLATEMNREIMLMA